MLPGCLDSLRGVADELVVVDTGSTDHTVEIARRAGARLGHFAWCDDFAAARNATLDLATGRWVLSIDADERLVGPGDRHVDGANVHRVLASNVADVFQIAIRSVMADSSGALGEEMDCVRLWRHHDRHRYTGTVHEQVLPCPGDRLALGRGLTLLHLGYTPRMVATKRKNERNLALLQPAVTAKPRDAHLQFQLGLELCSCGRLNEAAEHLRIAWEAIPVPSPAYWAPLAFRLVDVLTEIGALDEATSINDELVREHPRTSLWWAQRGRLLRRRGELPEAVESLERALAAPDDDPQMFYRNHAALTAARINLGLCYESLGNQAKAVDCYRTSLLRDPDNRVAAERLSHILGRASGFSHLPLGVD